MISDKNQLISKTIQELENILSKEKELLLGPPGEKIEYLAEKKNDLIALLARESGSYREDYTPEILAAIERCHSRNRENAGLVNQRLKITRQSLGIIRQYIGNDVVSLYDTTGKLNQKIESRKVIKV